MRRVTGTDNFGSCGSFSFIIHTATITGDHLSSSYSANLDNYWVMVKWMAFRHPSPLMGTGDREPGW